MSRRTYTISFSGVDGAGKSTQIEALRKHLEQDGLRVRVIAFWNEIAAMTPLREGAGHKIFNGDKGVGRPEAPVNRRDKNVRSFPMACARLCLYFLDAISTRVHFQRALSSGADVIIFDRYLYDQFANLSLRNPAVRAYIRLLMKFVPRPDVSIVLDADPREARARKPEYPLEFLYINRRAYLDLRALLGGLTVIPPMGIRRAHAEILRYVAAGASLKGDGGSEKGEALPDRDESIPLRRAG